MIVLKMFILSHYIRFIHFKHDDISFFILLFVYVRFFFTFISNDRRVIILKTKKKQDYLPLKFYQFISLNQIEKRN